MDFVDRRLPFFDGSEMVIEDRKVDRLKIYQFMRALNVLGITYRVGIIFVRQIEKRCTGNVQALALPSAVFLVFQIRILQLTLMPIPCR